MGSCSDMASSNLVAELLKHSASTPGVKSLIGQTLTIVDAGVSTENCSSIQGWVEFEDQSGHRFTVDLGTEMEITDDGILGYSLENFFSDEEIVEMIQSALADNSNSLSSDDRDELRELLEEFEG